VICPTCGHRDRHSHKRCWKCDPPDLSTFQGRLRRCLLDHKMSVVKFSELAGFDRGSIGNMLAFNRPPTLELVYCAAQIFGVRAGWLAFGEEPRDGHLHD
jgi:transcriptional regulator with XRE-family HTH domain